MSCHELERGRQRRGRKPHAGGNVCSVGARRPGWTAPHERAMTRAKQEAQVRCREARRGGGQSSVCLRMRDSDGAIDEM